MKTNFDRDKFRPMLHKTGLTQGEFGYLIGKSQGSISSYLAGRAKPNKNTIERMAAALHCSFDDLLEDNQDLPDLVQEITEEKYKTEEQYKEEQKQQKQEMAFESLMTAIELIKIARDMLGEIRKEKGNANL